MAKLSVRTVCTSTDSSGNLCAHVVLSCFRHMLTAANDLHTKSPSSSQQQVAAGKPTSNAPPKINTQVGGPFPLLFTPDCLLLFALWKYTCQRPDAVLLTSGVVNGVMEAWEWRDILPPASLKQSCLPAFMHHSTAHVLKWMKRQRGLAFEQQPPSSSQGHNNAACMGQLSGLLHSMEPCIVAYKTKGESTRQV